MSKRTIARFAGLAIGSAMVLGAAAPAGAVTIAELQAQIAALMAQLAALQAGSSAGAAITSDLTVGSTGSQVVSLQSSLVSQGYLVMPAGVAMGYFGPLTKAAVQAWQAAHGVPSTGYFGPLSRAAWSTSGAGTTTGGTTTGGTTSSGVITTPGVEGTLTASLNPSPASGTKLYEGSTNKDVMGIKLEAKTSDIKVERVKLQLKAVTASGDNLFYTKIAKKIYLKDGSNILASSDLNSSTVVKESSDYFITLSGFGYVVPKDSTRVLTVALDAMSNWDTTYNDNTWRLTVPMDGVRGVDGAGVNQYSPATAFSRDFTSAADLTDSATLAVSLNAGTPDTRQVVATGGADEDEISGVELLKADFKAEKDNMLVTDMVVDLVRSGDTTTATATTAYLYEGSTLIGSATVAGTGAGTMTATFSDIDWTVPADSTKTLSVKVDIQDAGATATTFYATISGGSVTAENSAGDPKTPTGSASSSGRVLSVVNVGPEITLNSKSITTSGVPQGSGTSNISTSTMTATFNVTITAKGGDLLLGTVASGTPVLASSTSFSIYRNGAKDATISASATSTAYDVVTGSCVSTGTNTCKLAEGASVTFPVTFQITGRKADSTPLTTGLYSVQLEQIKVVADGAVETTNFMTGDSAWRTADVSFP